MAISQAAWAQLAPLLVLAAGILVLMLQSAVKRNRTIAVLITLLTLAATCLTLLASWPQAPVELTPLLVADAYGYLFSMLFTLAGLCVVLMSIHTLWHYDGYIDEYLLLVLTAVLGALVLCYARHLASLLLGIELLGVSLYTLIAYPNKTWLPLEAGIKYLVLSGAGSAILLFGFALLYAELGVLSFEEIGDVLSGRSASLLILVSSAMILTGLGFKLSLVPYHMWTPDVYEGSPTPVSGFLATVSKGAIFVALLRWYLDAGLYRLPALLDCLSLLAILSMLVGNLLALRQANVKRLLAYSSIAHMGYLVLALVVCGFLADPGLATEAAGYYVVAYLVTTLAAFAALTQLPNSNENGCEINDLHGLFWREPIVAVLLTVAMLSLAGIPLTVGFVGKFYLIAAGVSAQLWPLLGALLVGSAIGIYYYLRVVYSMTLPADSAVVDSSGPGTLRLRGVTLMLIAAVLYLGIYPQPLISYLSQAL